MKYVIVHVVLALVVGVVALIFMWPDSPARPSIISVMSEGDEEPEEMIDLAVHPPLDEATADPQREAVAHEPEPTSPPTPEGLRVRVVDPEGNPLAGIPVALCARMPGNNMAFPVHEGMPSGDDGTVVLPIRMPTSEIPAGAGWAVGTTLPLDPPAEVDLGSARPTPSAPGEEVRLVLPANAKLWLEPLGVQVVDAAGQPVIGARVELEGVLRSDPGSRNRVAHAMTEGPDGIASVPRKDMIRGLFMGRTMGMHLDYEVVCDGPYDPQPSVAVPREPRKEPLRIVLPATTRLVAHLRNADGTAATEPGSVSLHWYRPGKERREGWTNVKITEGTARFEHVGLDVDLVVNGYLADGSVAGAEVRLPGPRPADEAVEVDLVLGPVKPQIVGRLLHEDGTPWVDQRFSMCIDLIDPPPRHPASGPRRLNHSYHGTDGEGRFAIPFGGDIAAPGRFLRIVEMPPPKRGMIGWTAHFTEIDFPRPSNSGTRLDAGDLVLEPVPILVSGMVVDEEGAPRRGAQIHLSYPLGTGSDRRWVNLHNTNSYNWSGEDGTFEIRSLERVEALRVSATKIKGGNSPEIEVPPFATNVRLVLIPEEDYAKTRGRVRGYALLDEGIPSLEVTAKIHGDGGGSQDSYVLGGHFEFTHLRPGQYRVALETYELGLPLTEVEGVFVEAGQANQDPRLQGIDLRGRLRLLPLRFETAAGKPIEKEYVWLGVERASGSIRTDAEGRVVALVRSEDETFCASCPGYAPVEFPWSATEQLLVLTPEAP